MVSKNKFIQIIGQVKEELSQILKRFDKNHDILNECTKYFPEIGLKRMAIDLQILFKNEKMLIKKGVTRDINIFTNFG